MNKNECRSFRVKNMSKCIRKICGLPEGLSSAKLTGEDFKRYHNVSSVFRRPSRKSYSHGKFKTGYGMYIIDKFVSEAKMCKNPKHYDHVKISNVIRKICGIAPHLPLCKMLDEQRRIYTAVSYVFSNTRNGVVGAYHRGAGVNVIANFVMNAQ